MQHAHTTAPTQLTESTLRALARSGLHQEPLIDGLHDPDRAKLGSPSDFDLNPELAARRLKQPAPRPTAVLVPIVSRSELTVLLTQRTKDLPSHAGQIAFPGGKMEPGDNGPVATAMRETQEEIGLEARFVEPIGYLDPYLTGTGFCVFPVVALVQEGFNLSPDASEKSPKYSKSPSRSLWTRKTTKRTSAPGTGACAGSMQCRFKTGTFGASPLVS